MLVFAIDSETIVRLSWWTGAICFLLIVIFAFLILIFRTIYNQRQKIVQQQRSKWEAILVDTLEFVPTELPVLNKRNTVSFLVLWNYLLESLKDETKENLIIVAYLLKLDEWSVTALQGRNVRRKLLALQTLGWLGEKSVWDELEKLAHHKSPTLSLAAVRSLMKIDLERAAEVFLPQIVKRDDWSFSVVGKILRETEAEIISFPLIQAALNAPDETAQKIIRFFDLAHMELTAPAIREIIERTENVEVILFCLRAIKDPADLTIVRDFLKNDDWRIRAQAAICLGKIGTEEDEKRLIYSAGDQEWWVRFRSAQALSSLPSMTIEKLETIADEHTNLYAQDAIQKIIEERRTIL
jgi:HEAT repeat protein